MFALSNVSSAAFWLTATVLSHSLDQSATSEVAHSAKIPRTHSKRPYSAMSNAGSEHGQSKDWEAELGDGRTMKGNVKAANNVTMDERLMKKDEDTRSGGQLPCGPWSSMGPMRNRTWNTCAGHTKGKAVR